PVRTARRGTPALGGRAARSLLAPGRRGRGPVLRRAPLHPHQRQPGPDPADRHPAAAVLDRRLVADGGAAGLGTGAGPGSQPRTLARPRLLPRMNPALHPSASAVAAHLALVLILCVLFTRAV